MPIQKFKQLIGSRAQVMHGTAKKTSGGLQKKDLKYNAQGKIVSKRASKSAKKSNNLVNAGYVTQKGVFGGMNPSEISFALSWIDPTWTEYNHIHKVYCNFQCVKNNKNNKNNNKYELLKDPIESLKDGIAGNSRKGKIIFTKYLNLKRKEEFEVSLIKNDWTITNSSNKKIYNYEKS